MSATRRGDVLANLLTALEAMSTANGYLLDWQAAYAEPPEDEPRMLPACAIEEGREEIASLAYPVLDWSASVTVHGFAAVARTSGVTVRETADAMVTDIIRAAMADTTRGGHAIDTTVVSAERMVEAPPKVWVMVTLRILYRTRMEEPTAGI